MTTEANRYKIFLPVIILLLQLLNLDTAVADEIDSYSYSPCHLIHSFIEDRKPPTYTRMLRVQSDSEIYYKFENKFVMAHAIWFKNGGSLNGQIRIIDKVTGAYLDSSGNFNGDGVLDASLHQRKNGKTESLTVFCVKKRI
jgi:hypothetical protein